VTAICAVKKKPLGKGGFFVLSHGIDNGEESHGDCDWKLVMTEMSISCKKYYAAHVLHVFQVFGDLQ
jgi:hypothetical protein